MSVGIHRPHFSSYAMLHAARKVFSNVKSTIAEEWSPLANETTHPISPANVTKIDLSASFEHLRRSLDLESNAYVRFSSGCDGLLRYARCCLHVFLRFRKSSRKKIFSSWRLPVLGFIHQRHHRWSVRSAEQKRSVLLYFLAQIWSSYCSFHGHDRHFCCGKRLLSLLGAHSRCKRRSLSSACWANGCISIHEPGMSAFGYWMVSPNPLVGPVSCRSWVIGSAKKGERERDREEESISVWISCSRGLIFGVWSACASVGNIIGAALAATFLKYGYEYPFLVCAILLLCCGIICLFGIVPSPEDVGMSSSFDLISRDSCLFIRHSNDRYVCLCGR